MPGRKNRLKRILDEENLKDSRMKEINLKDKSLNDVIKNISSILGVPKASTTDDRMGFIVERTSTDGLKFHVLVMKKVLAPKTREPIFELNTDEGTLNPRKVLKTLRLKDLKEVKIFFPNVLIGEEKKIVFEAVDSEGFKKQFEIKRDTYVTHFPAPPKESLEKKIRACKMGEIIFDDGESGEEMFIIQKGSVGLFKKTPAGEVQLAELAVGSFFGEMALMGNPKRSASAKAVTDAELLIINKVLFEHQLGKVPNWFVTMFKTTIDRLRHANDMIKALEKQLTDKQSGTVKSADLAKDRAKAMAAAQDKAAAAKKAAMAKKAEKPEGAPEKKEEPAPESDKKKQDPEPAKDEPEEEGLPPDMQPLDV